MPETAGDIEDTLDIVELTPQLLQQLVARLEESTTWAHYIYREAEIDQVWRLVERADASAALSPDLVARLREGLMQVHDLVGVDHEPRRAAHALRTILQV